MKTNFGRNLIRLWAAAICGLLLNGSAFAQDDDAAAALVSATNDAVTASAETATNVAAEAEVAADGVVQEIKPERRQSRGDIVVFGRSVEIKEGEEAHDVVTIFGSSEVRGKAHDVVAVFGSVSMNGSANDVVSVFGNVHVGTNASVRGDAVAVMGNVRVETNAEVRGDMVSVGGSAVRSDGSAVGGDVFGLPGLPWIGDWLEQCVYKLRPMSPHLTWMWVLAGVSLMFSVLLAVGFPRAANACVEEIAQRPATTILIGLLTKILIPFVVLVLLITGIGVFIVPFVFLFVWVAAFIGKIGLCQYFGGQLGRQTGATVLQRPLPALLVGWTIITALYMVPVVGLIVWALVGLWSLGAAMMAMFAGTRREMPQRTSPPPAQKPIAPVEVPATATGFAPENPTGPESQPSSAQTRNAQEWFPPPIAAGLAPAGTQSTTAEAVSLPRAGFWERMGAGFLDLILVAILSGLVGGLPLGLLVALAYFAGMWAWRGTTVGGIVLNLKVVRYDGQQMNFAVALVRGLMAAFSAIVFFLGFLWIAWDSEKQAWHDKLAGTVVVRQPRGSPLLCL